jgi:hypothetical protein
VMQQTFDQVNSGMMQQMTGQTHCRTAETSR